MSSADSALLAAASIFAKNAAPLFRKNQTDEQSLTVVRIMIPVIGIIAIFVALEFQKVFDLMVDSNILGLAAIIVPFILGVWWTKANRTGALSGMAAGIAGWLITMAVAPELPADFMGLGACLVVMLIVTPLTQQIDPPKTLCDSDGNPIDTSDRLGTLPLFRKS
jgi:Na+/proline symporter